MVKIQILSMVMFFVLSPLDGYAQSTFMATVIRIIDGDSIVVKTEEQHIEVRLYGIDSPEWKQSFSPVSRKYMETHFFKKKVMVIPQYYDSYGRLVALIVYNGHSVNGEMVANGMAWVYPRYCRKKICKAWRADQKRAERESRGLWQFKDPVSPWRWKSMKRAH